MGPPGAGKTTLLFNLKFDNLSEPCTPTKGFHYEELQKN